MKEIKIGNQIWTTQNLDVDCFTNGDPIFEAATIEQWIEAGNAGQPAWCINEKKATSSKGFPFYSGRQPKKKSKIEVGKLYNWFAVNDPRGLAPEGWKIPSDDDWSELIEFLGGKSIAGMKMKFTACWDEYYRDGESGTNESGFFGLPGGLRNPKGSFVCFGEDGFWWSSTELDKEKAWRRDLTMENDFCYRSSFDKKNGYSIRCIKL